MIRITMPEDLTLLPMPRYVEWGSGSASSHAPTTARVDSDAVDHAQGYRLTITPEAATITGHDQAGVFYGQCTLTQLRRQFDQLPCLHIDDWPDFSRRGVMLDISRDKVPTMQTLKGLIDNFSEWKFNELQLYTEHTFAYQNHRQVWEHASPMTAEEVRELDAYCRQRYIDLVPNQNSLGHMERWLEHERYRDLAECPDGFTRTQGWHSAPTTLCPTDPRSLTLMEQLYDEMLANFSSKQFNVGLDEPWELGMGRSRADRDAPEVSQIYLDYVKALYDRVTARGFTMQFWGDIVLKHEQVIPQLPGDAIVMDWGYESDYPFDHTCGIFERLGLPFYVCPGTSSWNSFAGRTRNALGNLENAATNGLAHGARGMLLTDWGDNGHWQPLPSSFLGFAYGAGLSWAVEANRDVDITRVLDHHVFEDKAHVMGRVVYDLGALAEDLGLGLKNKTELFLLLWQAEHIRPSNDLSADLLRKVEQAIDHAIAPMDHAKSQRGDGDLLKDEIRLAAEMLRCASRVGRVAAGESVNQIDTNRLLNEYRRIWLKRNRPGGLEDSIAKMRAFQ